MVRMIDDATSWSWGRFVESDGTRQNMGVLWEYLERNGRMVDVYTDRHPMFTVTRAGESPEEQRKADRLTRVVLSGGANTSVALNDTWTWDGTDWTLADPGTGPGRRMNHAMAYDRIRQQVLLFGGCDENLNFSTDTWTWDGSTWTRRLSSGAPPPRTDFGMVFDQVAGRIVISGGLEGQHDTWSWDGSQWCQLMPEHLPPVLGLAQMAYDERLERSILLLDNYPNQPQTWKWDGTDWTQLMPAQNPAPRSAGGIVWDGVRGQVVLFGGDTSSGGLNDTWAFAPPTVILTPQSVSVARDGSGNYMVTTTLKNTGNTAAMAVDATIASIVGPHTVTSTTFTAGQFTTVAPGATGAITTKFPAGTPSGVYSFTIQGLYGSVSVSTGSWSAAFRVIVLLWEITDDKNDLGNRASDGRRRTHGVRRGDTAHLRKYSVGGSTGRHAAIFRHADEPLDYPGNTISLLGGTDSGALEDLADSVVEVDVAPTAASVPEPTSLLLLVNGIGLFGLRKATSHCLRPVGR